VRVDGVVARLGDRADPRVQAITVDGRAIEAEPRAYWMLHKPRGVLSTARDPRGRRTVLDLVPSRGLRLFPVGRLDSDTEGLLLLTNDGALAHALLHPSLGNERVYVVTARGRLSEAARRRLARGVLLEEGRTAPARVGVPRFDAAADTTTFRLVLREGRKRQIRRALASLGHPVVRLLRTGFGPLRLGALAAGAARPLAGVEIRALQRHVAQLRRRQATGSGPGQAGGGVGEGRGGAPSRSRKSR
jgi:23S rRNA pseudouridine2605 synthase